MSPSSRAAIRFVIALFLAQTFVNAVAVPHPHIHKVLDPRQVVSYPVVERQEPEQPESKNVFDAIIDTLKGYNGWQVFTDFFRKLFSGESPAVNDAAPTSVIVIPTLGASSTSVDIGSVIQSVISEIASATVPVVVVPPGPSTTEVPEASITDPIMSILPIGDLTTAIDLNGTIEVPVPTAFLSETTEAPEATAPIVVVIPPVELNSTEVIIALPTEAITPPIVTAPIVTGPVEVAPSAIVLPPFPVQNGTIVAPIHSDGVPVVVILPTGISSPVNANASVSAGVSAELNVTVSLTSTIDLTVTLEPTDAPSVGTGLPVTFSELPIYTNETAITPTVVLVTGTGDVVGTIAPTISVEPISAPFANFSDAATAVAPIGTAPIGTGVVVIGTGVLASTGIVSVEPIQTIVLGTGIVGTGIVGTGDATAVAPVETAIAPFANTTTAVEVVIEPTFVLGTVTAPAVGTISAAPILSAAADATWANTTTTTVTNVITPPVILGTGDLTAVLPIGTGVPGTIVVIPAADSTDVLFPNITLTINATADATLSIELPLVTAAPIETAEVSILPLNVTLAPIPTISDIFPVIPVETLTAVAPIVDESIPSDAPVVEFPGEPIIPTLPAIEIPPIEEPTPIIPVIPVPSVEPVEEQPSILPAPVEVPSILPAPVIPIFSIAAAEASPVEASASAEATIAPVISLPLIPVEASASVEAAAAATATIIPVVDVAPAESTAVAIPAIVPVVTPAAPAATVVPVVPVAPVAPTLPLAPILPVPVVAPAAPAILPQ